MNAKEIREEVMRRQKAATAKIARLKRQGVQLSGSEYDVRRDPSKVARYNSTQLRSYLGQLNEFTNRNRQFVPGSEGVPIPRHIWNQLERTQAEFKTFSENHYNGVKDTFIPQRGVTIGKQDSDVLGKARAKGGVSRPISFEDRKAYEFPNAERVKDMRDAMEQKMRTSYLPKKLTDQHDQLMEAIKVFGNDDLTTIAQNLTYDQVDALWNYSDAPRDLFAGYHHQKLLAAGKADDTDSNIHDDAEYETRQWLDWAASIPSRGNRTNRKKES